MLATTRAEEMTSNIIQIPSLKTKPKARSKEEKLRSALPRGDYVKQGAITMYTQRISEGCYSSTSGSGATQFGRSAAFTNDMTDARVSHIEGTDDHTNLVRGAPPPDGSDHPPWEEAHGPDVFHIEPPQSCFLSSIAFGSPVGPSGMPPNAVGK